MSRRNSRHGHALGLPPQEGSIYERALTHRSFAFEQPEPPPHNERLEFLGDAVLEAIVSELIFRRYPQFSEGEMTRLRAAVVNEQPLAELARGIGIGEHLRLGKGEESSGGRNKPSLLANALEALVAALYLEEGVDAARGFVGDRFGPLLEAAVRRGGGYDAKSALQEFVMRGGGSLPRYQVKMSGPEHQRRFAAHAYVGNELVGSGEGKTKKEAEQVAAKEALVRLGAPDAPEGRRDARAS